MANKTLNFNTLERPCLELTMMDDAQTVIKVGMPSEGLVAQLEQLGANLTETLTKGDKDTVDACYDLAARFISCNRNFIEVTGEELRTRYRLDLEALVIFFSAYIDFIEALKSQKNS